MVKKKKFWVPKKVQEPAISASNVPASPPMVQPAKQPVQNLNKEVS